jgi:hypothetical protein
MHTYLVTYYYLATGMEGRADRRNFGYVTAKTPQEAKEKVAYLEVPVRKNLGRDLNEYDRDFFKGCLTATEVK